MKDDITASVGDLFIRREKIIESIKEIEKEVEGTTDNNRIDYLMGKRDAIREAASYSHLKIIRKLTEANIEIDNIKDCEFLSFEYNYLEGFATGLITVLDIDNMIPENRPDFIMFVITKNEKLFEKYRTAFNLFRGFTEFPSTGGPQFKVVKRVEEVVDCLKTIGDDANYIINVVYEEEPLPNYEELKELNQYDEDRILLTKCNSDNIKKIITRLIRATII